MTEPIFLTRQSVEEIHAASIKEFGGSLGIRDENALESAIAQPVTSISTGRLIFSSSLPHTRTTLPRTSRLLTETSVRRS